MSHCWLTAAMWVLPGLAVTASSLASGAWVASSAQFLQNLDLQVSHQCAPPVSAVCVTVRQRRHFHLPLGLCGAASCLHQGQLGPGFFASP